MAETFLSGAEFDQPVYEGKPRRVYMICSTGRSGSTLLCSLLTNTGVMGVPHEYLNISRHGQFLITRFLGERDASVSMGEYFDAVVKHRTSPNGVFGIKAHSNQWLPYFKNGFLSGYFGDIKHVVIRRRDILGQAISLVIASQTGKWTSHEEQISEPIYDRGEIEKAIKVTEHYNEIWDKFFAHAEIEPCTVFYEDLLERPTEEIQGVLDFVGVDAKVSIDLEQAGLKREATALNQEWKDRFNKGSA
jgi:LPS sulfotransferase NodH